MSASKKTWSIKNLYSGGKKKSEPEKPPPLTQSRQDDENINVQAQIEAQAKAEAAEKAKSEAEAQAEAKALEEAQNQRDEKDTNASSGGEGDEPTPPARPRRRGRELPARKVRTTVDGDHVRVPYTFRKDQLAMLEQMKASIYQKTGKWVDKSTLAREAFDLLFAQWPDLAGKTEQVAKEAEAA